MSSAVLRHAGAGWEGIERRLYKTDDEGRHRGVTRQTLCAAGTPGLASETRYFEIEPGGFSSRERHRHAHFVVVVRGSGRVELDGEEHALRQFDAVYVAPGSVHRFHADAEALGFLCVVDGERDRPEPVPAANETSQPSDS